ncbi:Putative MEMO1 family protein [Septoria linicola]|uniref:MEMO1 family protein n=1 Tax=Septoria linicola TaxID=215465 RepID=A0A9Q9AJF2_9PEZI|nr:putative MEMO1 family protein [Septoria linicola]USW47263.1 Putative MEMO1 family protein [Septoria linicola]
MSSSDQITRHASHAGSWYSSSESQLDTQLEGWLAAVNSPVACIGPQSEGQSYTALPVTDARIIIAPHAGYSYSGPAAAWAYKSWDVSKAKKVFLLGPSHHHPLSRAALSRCTQYATPLGNLTIDRETTARLYGSGKFEWMSQSVDEDEHSLEMHLPYIFKMLSKTFGDDPARFPPLVPIMVGNTSPTTERSLGRILAEYLDDPENAFVISSDFAHWGSRFRYTYYQPTSGPAVDLRSSAPTPRSPAIHESIKNVDFVCMGACESGKHQHWLDTLEDTGNTVCGRHPIGVIMAAVEEVRKKRGDEATGQFRFVQYDRSSLVNKVSDSSVSYASAFATIS